MENIAAEKTTALTKIAGTKMAKSVQWLYEILMKEKLTMDDEQRPDHEFTCQSIREKL